MSTPPAIFAGKHADAGSSRIGHGKLDFLAKYGTISYESSQRYRNSPWSGCLLADSTRDAYSAVKGLMLHPGDVLQPYLQHFPNCTIDGKRYALTCVGEHSRFVEACLLAKNSNAAGQVIRTLTRYHTLHGRCVKHLRTDIGGDIQSTALEMAKKHLRVSVQHITAWCHESNSLFERFNRTLVQISRSLLESSLFPWLFRGKSMFVLCAYLKLVATSVSP